MSHSSFHNNNYQQNKANTANVGSKQIEDSSLHSVTASLPQVSLEFKNKCLARGVDSQIAQVYQLLGILNQRATQIAKIHPKFLLDDKAKKQIAEFEGLRTALRFKIEEHEKNPGVPNETKLKLRQILGEGFVLASEAQQKQREQEEIAAKKTYDALPAWRRIINPVVNGLRTFPEKATQIIGFTSEGYKGYVLGFIKGLEAGVNPFSLALDVSAANIANLREHYELTTKYGCILGNTGEFSKSNNWSDLWKLHPISLYGNPITESLSSAYDEYQLWIVNKTAGASLGYNDFKKIQNETEALKWGVRSFNVAQIAGFTALNAGITAPSAALSSVYAKNSLRVSLGLSSVTSLGQEFLSQDGFSFIQLGDNILASTAGSLSFQAMLNIGGLAQIKTANHLKLNNIRAKLLAQGADAEKTTLTIEKYLKLSNHKRWQSFKNFSSQQDQIDGMGDFSQTFENMGCCDWKDWKSWVGNALVLAGNTQDTFDISLSRKLSEKVKPEQPQEQINNLLNNVDLVIPAKLTADNVLLETKNRVDFNDRRDSYSRGIIFPRPLNNTDHQDNNNFALATAELTPNYTLGATVDSNPYVPNSNSIWGISSLEIFNISDSNGGNDHYTLNDSDSQNNDVIFSSSHQGKTFEDHNLKINLDIEKLSDTSAEIRETLKLFQAQIAKNLSTFKQTHSNAKVGLTYTLDAASVEIVTAAFIRTLDAGELNLAAAIFATFRIDLFILNDGGPTHLALRSWARKQTNAQKLVDLSRVILDQDLLEQSAPSGFRIQNRSELIDHIFYDVEIQDNLEALFLDDLQQGIFRIPHIILDPSLLADKNFAKSAGISLQRFCGNNQNIEQTLRLLRYFLSTEDTALADNIFLDPTIYATIRTRLNSAVNQQINYLKVLEFAAEISAKYYQIRIRSPLSEMIEHDNLFINSARRIVNLNHQGSKQKVENLIKKCLLKKEFNKVEYLSALFDEDLYHIIGFVQQNLTQFLSFLENGDSWNAFYTLREFSAYPDNVQQWVRILVASHHAFRNILIENNLRSVNAISSHLNSNKLLWVAAARIRDENVASSQAENIHLRGVGGKIRKSRSGKVCHVSSVELLQAMYLVTRTTMLAMDSNPELREKSIPELEELAQEEAKNVDAFFDPIENMIVVPEITAFSTKATRIVALHKVILAEHEMGHVEVEKRREKGEVISFEEEELIAWRRAEKKARRHGIKIDFSGGIPKFDEVEPEINVRLRNIILSMTKIKTKLLLNTSLATDRKRLENELRTYENYLLRLRSKNRSLTPRINQLLEGEGELYDETMILRAQPAKTDEIRNFIKNAAAYRNLSLTRSIASGGASEETKSSEDSPLPPETAQKAIEVTQVITVIEQELNQEHPDLQIICNAVHNSSLKPLEICSPLMEKDLFRKLNRLVLHELKNGRNYQAALTIASRLTLLDSRQADFYEIACHRLNRLCHNPESFFQENEDNSQITYPLEAQVVKQAENDFEDLQAIAALFNCYHINDPNKKEQQRLLNYALWAYEFQIQMSAAWGDLNSNPFIQNARTIDQLFPLPEKERHHAKWQAIKYIVNKINRHTTERTAFSWRRRKNSSK